LYAAANRITPERIEKGVWIDYLTDDFSHAGSMFLKLKQKLSRLLQVKVARLEFNKAKGMYWLTDGMRAPLGSKVSTMKRAANEYLVKAKELINSKVRFNYLGMAPRGRFSAMSHGGRLASLKGEVLDSLLFSGKVSFNRYKDI
jgi:hypothetical protein